MPAPMHAPTTAPYLICATPRSGSTLLCDLLTATGVAGRPEEYFQLLPITGRARHPREYLAPVWEGEIAAILGERSPVDDEPTQLEQRGAATFDEYLERIRAIATTPNGVFGAKVMWGYFPGLIWHLDATAVAEDLPVVVVVVNNGFLGMVRQWQDRFHGGRRSASELTQTGPDLAALARAYGCEAAVVESPDELGPAFDAALEARRPFLLDCRCDPVEECFPMLPPGAAGRDVVEWEGAGETVVA